MTRKFAVCDVPRGGGKGVLAVPELPTGDARTELLHRYGEFITSLGGLYSCAPDMNTSEHDMDMIAETCPYVFCKTVENGGSGSTSPATAQGVFYGIEASVQHALEHATCRACACSSRASARSARCSRPTWPRRARTCSSPTSTTTRLTVGTPVAPDEVVGIECDVLAPCATGGIDQRRHGRRSCAAGSSPAPPTTSSPSPSLADRLHERGILYAPDYVINAGGVLHGAGLESLGWTEAAGRRAPARHRHPAARALRGRRRLTRRTPPTASSSGGYARRR